MREDETLQKIEEGNGRINMGLLLVLLAMFLTASTVQNIYIIVAGMVVIAAGELVRPLLPPRILRLISPTRACGSADYGGHHTDRTHRDALCREVRRAAAERRGPTAPDALCLRRRTATRQRCGGWRNSPISG